MIKLIVFDCDGVMFDSKPANQEYYDHVLEHFGKTLMDKSELEYVHTHNVTDCINHIFRHHLDINPEEIETYRASLNYSQFLPHFKIEPDLVEFLETSRHNYHLAISTNRSDTMELLLNSFDLSHFFGKVMTATNAKKPKPAPDGMLEILDYYNCKPEETIFIGDSIIDQLHAVASGTQLIAFKNKKLETDYHISSFMEIFELPNLSISKAHS